MDKGTAASRNTVLDENASEDTEVSWGPQAAGSTPALTAIAVVAGNREPAESYSILGGLRYAKGKSEAHYFVDILYMD